LAHNLAVRTKSDPNGKARPSFIEEARRRQIVETAIETIARKGFSQASLAEIARKAGCSKGVISYHFDGKEELFQEILSHLLRAPGPFVKERVDARDGAAEKLKAYVRANFEMMRDHRDHYVALVDLWGSRGWSEGRNRFNAEAFEPSRRYLSRILEQGQASGELRAFPVMTMASVIEASIDGVALQWVCDPNAVDLDACADEIADMIGLHVGPESGERRGYR